MTDEQRQERIHYHMYLTNEGIAEHAERIVALEELMADMYRDLVFADYYLKDTGRTVKPYEYASRMRELGIEVTR